MKNKNTKVILIALILISLCCCYYGIAPNQTNNTNKAITPKPTNTAQQTNTVQPANTTQPTNTAQATNTSSPATTSPTTNTNTISNTPTPTNTTTTQQQNQEEQTPKVIANNSNVNLRQGPGTNYSIAGTLPQGNSLKIVGQYQDWYQVETQQGDLAWIANFVIDTENTENIDIPTITNIPPTPIPPTNTATVQIIPTNTAITIPPTQPPSQHPSGATAICNDGTYSYSANRRGTCSRHGGVRTWLTP